MSPSSDALLLSVSGEPIITAADLCRSHRAAAKQDQDRVNQLNPSSSNSVLGRAMERSQSVVFPANKDRLSREFAEQFHESVLRSTIQKEHQRNGDHLLCTVCWCLCLQFIGNDNMLLICNWVYMSAVYC